MDMMNLAKASAAPIRRGLTRAVLKQVNTPHIGLVIWTRLGNRTLLVSASALRTLPPFTWTAEGPPIEAARQLFKGLPLFYWRLYADIRMLAQQFASISGSPDVKIRLEHVIDNSCVKFHVDNVGLRLLCTYAGPGTEWLDQTGRVRQLSIMETAIFKGTKFPLPGERVRHRSPRVEHLPPEQRSRLVLCIDEPDEK